MYVFIITDTNGPEPEPEPITDIVGPYPTAEAAEEAARNWFRELCEIEEFDMVRSYEVKPVRSYEKSVTANTSWSRLWQRIYDRGLDGSKW